MKPQPGTYALVFSSTVRALIRVARLGRLQLEPGFYAYVGSAYGPGGLQARLAHHLEPTDRPHWHIDYLRAHVTPEEVWYCYGRIPWEHRWAHCLSLQRSTPVSSKRCGTLSAKRERVVFPKDWRVGLGAGSLLSRCETRTTGSLTTTCPRTREQVTGNGEQSVAAFFPVTCNLTVTSPPERREAVASP